LIFSKGGMDLFINFCEIEHFKKVLGFGVIYYSSNAIAYYVNVKCI